jgi:hypothetical protein
MKKSLAVIIILLVGIIINFSCTKTGMNAFPDSHLNSNAKIVPNVPQCGPGQHWSYYLNKCVDVCSNGYHNDSITGACVVNGGVGPLRICSEDFAQFNLDGLTFSAAVDSIGKWHNDYQISLLAKMQGQNVNLNTDSLQSFLKNSTNSFMASKGINHQNTSIPNLNITDTTWNISSYSSTAKSILNQLKSLVDNYTVSQHSSFISQCTTLKTSALNLQTDNEAISVGMEVSIAINSFNYWKDNVSLWKNYLVYSPNTFSYEKVAACDVNLKHLGGADIGGAITGARVGVGGGVAGAVAGGILGSAVYSAGNLIGRL